MPMPLYSKQQTKQIFVWKINIHVVFTMFQALHYVFYTKI